MVFDLFTHTIEYQEYAMHRGEAKRHELMLYFHKGQTTAEVQETFRCPLYSCGAKS